MQTQLITVKHKDTKSAVEIFYEQKRMTIHLKDNQLMNDLQSSSFSINSNWELEMENDGQSVDTDSVKRFFINMLEQKNDLVTYFD